MAADRAAPTVAFEARADAHGIRHLIGIQAEHLRWANRTLRDLMPGLELESSRHTEERKPVSLARRLRARPIALALAVDRPESVTRALLSALHAHLGDDEGLVVQILLGPRLGPRHVRGDIGDPDQPLWQRITRGTTNAPAPVRRQIETRAGQHGFATTIRLGVTAADPDRRQRLVIGLLGALSTAQGVGVYVDLVPDSPSRLNEARPPRRWPLRLAVPELVGLLAWPITTQGSDGELPGLPPLHPKQLRVPASVDGVERVFAQSAGGGPLRSVGVSAASSLRNLVALGPTGTGKSNALLHLIKADIEAGRAVLVVDPKRQLIDSIIDRAVPEHRVGDIVIMDPASDRPPGFNPLDVGDRDPDVVVDGLLAVFAAIFKDGWGPRTQDIMHSSLLTLARAGSRRAEPFTLLDLPRLLTDDALRRNVIGHPEVADDPGLGPFWAWYQAMTPVAQAQAIAAPLNKLRQYLLRPALRRILGQPHPTFKLRDIFRARKIVLVPLNEGLIGPMTAHLLGSLVVAEAWQATLERASETSPTDEPAMVYVDEVQQYLHLPTSIGDALAQTRSMGVGWHLAHQYRAQLPPEMRAAVDSNARSKLVFQPTDPDDARDMARQAPALEPIDFLTLPSYHAYANLVSDGSPAGWCLVKTLPPPEESGLGERIRQASRQAYGQLLRPGTPDPATDSDHPPTAPLGRKRRAT
ncbi:type IV secretory system conjugative DNA transfer family protein [Nakamurella silvestris]|nr:type IV secretory system conjugative DNA transfer family protein [Nakamurella silvestris]